MKVSGWSSWPLRWKWRLEWFARLPCKWRFKKTGCVQDEWCEDQGMLIPQMCWLSRIFTHRDKAYPGQRNPKSQKDAGSKWHWWVGWEYCGFIWFNIVWIRINREDGIKTSKRLYWSCASPMQISGNHFVIEESWQGWFLGISLSLLKRSRSPNGQSIHHPAISRAITDPSNAFLQERRSSGFIVYDVFRASGTCMQVTAFLKYGTDRKYLRTREGGSE